MIPQRIIRPLWHPVSLLLSIVLVGLPPGLLGIEFPQSTEAAAVILAVVFILHYFVWSIPVRLGYITPPPEFGGGDHLILELGLVGLLAMGVAVLLEVWGMLP